ncbi:replication initiation and membrane attachment family protein [Aureibacillus halotolerans]|uniref:Replicative DNA helicase loader DnaB n=1 Tax=Aureibacillus halotolerans TaxID=1508390 RepID=A0A4R6U3Z5_9BACI|nr:DnaD domain protein [Aureibacillus halotolerans]TDQ39155.1 replicative DNA helicase loader DnaB [Aureibacillus halotolerans]
MTEHWKDVLPVDQYEITTNGMLHLEDHAVLQLLYQPLVGAIAMGVFQTLISEHRRRDFQQKTHTHHFLMNVLALNLQQIYEARQLLEGIGLLKTYRQKSENVHQFVYELQSPMQPAEFFSDGLLNIFLYQKIGKTAYDHLKELFEVPSRSTDDYVVVTKSFTDVFQSIKMSDLQQTKPPETPADKTMEKAATPSGVTIETDTFDFSLLLSGLHEAMVPKQAITPKVKTAIYKLAFLYRISPLEMKKILMSALTQHEEIDVDILRKQAREWYQFESGETLPAVVHQTQPAQAREFKDSPPETEEDKLIHALEISSPHQMLTEWSGGAQPSEADLRMVEDVMFQQKLPAGVVNVLLYFVMLRSDSKLTKSYVQKIAGHWARKKVMTVRQAMALAKDENAKYKEWQTEGPKKRTAKAIRTEKLPSWMDTQNESPSETLSEQERTEQRELEERLKKFASRTSDESTEQRRSGK